MDNTLVRKLPAVHYPNHSTDSEIHVGMAEHILGAQLNIGRWHSIMLTFAYAVLFSEMGVIFGTNRIRWSKTNPADLIDLIPAWILATTIAFLANLFLGYLPAYLILLGFVFSLFGFIAIRGRSMIITYYLKRSIIF